MRSVALFVLTFELTSLRATLRFVAFDRREAPDRCDASEPTTETASSSFSTAAAAAMLSAVGGLPEASAGSLKLCRSAPFSLSTRSRQQSEYCCAVILKGCGARRRRQLSGAGATWEPGLVCASVCVLAGSPSWM